MSRPDEALEYMLDTFHDPDIVSDYRLLAEMAPSVFKESMDLRQVLFGAEGETALTPRVRELVVLGIEIALKKSNPPPIGHTRAALAAGATPEEIGEVVGLCVMIAGMLSYRESGRLVLQEVAARSA